jgi:hypothetical protein
VPQVSRFSRPGIQQPPQSWKFARLTPILLPEICSNACRVPQVSRFSRPGIPLLPQSWNFARLTSILLPEICSNARRVNLTKSSLTNPHNSKKQTNSEPISPFLRMLRRKRLILKP